MLTAAVVSVATAWTVAPVSGPAGYYQPTVQYQPAAVSALPAARSAVPAGAAFATQLPSQALPLPSARRPSSELGALDACAVFGLGALIGYGVSQTHAALGVGGDGAKPVPGSKPKYGAPKGAFGGSTADTDEGWVGDQGKSLQVKKFEEGNDYLFFQGPAPLSAIQPDLPDFFSAENFADMQIKPLQIVFTVVGFGSLAAVIYLLTQ